MIKTLKRQPKEYPEQEFNQCGAYSVKAILSAYGKDDKEHARDYQVTRLAKYIGTHQGLTVWPEVLRSYGVPAQRGSTRSLIDEQRIETLKNLINKDKIVMLRIGNGYAKNGKYRPSIATYMGHWITLWGYNDEEHVFYVYDPYLDSSRRDKTIPIGNVKRTFSEILRDWGKGFPTAWRHTYIKVG